MSKRISHELTYPGASLEQVVAMIRDPAFREAVADRQHVIDRSVRVSGENPTTILVKVSHGTERVPSFARKLVGDRIPIHQSEIWTSDTSADVTITIPDKPGDMTGTARIEERGSDVVETYDLEVKVGIPMVGGKIEALVADLLVQAFQSENKVGVKWLAGEWR